MAIFFSVVLVFVGVVFSYIGYNVAILHSFHSFVNNFDRDKLRYKNAEAHAIRMGWIDIIVGVVMLALGIVNFILQSETLGMYFLGGTVVALFLGLILNDNFGLK